MAKKPLQGDELLKYLEEIEETGMSVTRQWHTIWQQAIMYTWSEQLHGIKKNPDWEYIVANYIYPLMMQQIAKLSKNNPKILGRPWSDDDAEFAEQWQGIIQYIWEQSLNMRLDTVNALLDASVFGYAVGKVYWQNKLEWDKTQKQWIGDVRHRLIHPADFWADPAAERMKDAQNCGTRRKVRLDWAIKQWPEREEEIRAQAEKEPDVVFSNTLSGFSTQAPIYQGQSSSTIRSKFMNVVSLIFGTNNSTATAPDNQIEFVWLSETYFVDDSEKHVLIEDNESVQNLVDQGVARLADDGSGMIVSTKDSTPIPAETWPKVKKAEYDEPIFPRGRYVLRIGKCILNPKTEDQIYTQSRWPFSVMVHHLLPHMWQGLNSVEMSRSSQDMLNSTIAHLVHHVKINANPMKIVESQTLAKSKTGKVREIKGKAGEIVLVKKGRKDGIRELPGGNLSPEVFTLVQLLRKQIETEQFMPETAQGISGNVQSATEAARLDTNAHDMVALKSVLLDKWIESTAILIAELVQAYYTPQRRIRIIGSDGTMTNDQMSDQLKNVEWDLEIEPGSTLPFDEQRRKDDYLAAYKILENPNPNPLLDDLLRVLNIANRQKVLMKHAGTQLFKQFVAMSAQIAAIPPEQKLAMIPKVMPQVLQLMEQVKGLVPQQQGNSNAA